MPTVTLRPNSLLDIWNGGYWSTSGGAYETVLGDGSDSTWAYTDMSSLGGQYIRCGLATFAVPSLAQIRSVQGWGRAIAWNASGNWFQKITFELRVNNTIAASTGSVTTGWSQIQTNGTPAPTTNPWGAAWNQADIDGLEIAAFPQDGGNAPGASSIRTYDLWATVVYNEAPSATITAPAGLLNPGNPSVAWSYYDPEGEAQERYQVKVFRKPTGDWGTLAPATNTTELVYDSGVVVSAATAQQLGALPGGVAYRAYVRVGDVGSSGRFGNWFPGPDFKRDLSGWGILN